MHIVKLLAGTALIGIFATPLAAQSTQNPAQASTPLPYDRGYDKDTPRTRAIDESGRPAVESANNAVLAGSSPDRAIDQGQYASDMAAYRAALRTRRHVMDGDMMRYDRQQRAYAGAMADWRAQVAACERGHHRACKLPTPNPADYM